MKKFDLEERLLEYAAETICLVKLILKAPLLPSGDRPLAALLKETDELIRIFASSIKTAKSNL